MRRDVSETALINAIGFDPTPKRRSGIRIRPLLALTVTNHWLRGVLGRSLPQPKIPDGGHNRQNY
jgi:hypothetical protein